MVLSLPLHLRCQLAWDHDLCRAVTRRVLGAILGFLPRRATVGSGTGVRVVSSARVNPLAAPSAPTRPARRCAPRARSGLTIAPRVNTVV